MAARFGTERPGVAWDGETAEETVRREALEECGRRVRLEGALGEAVETFAAGDTQYRMHATFLAARFVSEVISPPEHELSWRPAAEAHAIVLHRSHAWAIERWAGSPEIDADLVRGLVAGRFPRWADLPVEPVADGGWDNRTFRLGAGMSVRLPSALRYAGQVAREHRWLPVLAPRMPLPVPIPLAMGDPTDEYPFSWSVYRWLEGEPATLGRIADPCRLAVALARFLGALHRIDPAGGPTPERPNFFRGGPLATYDGETRDAIARLRGRIDAAEATAIWGAAPPAARSGLPMWVHADVAASNLLVRERRLGAPEGPDRAIVS